MFHTTFYLLLSAILACGLYAQGSDVPLNAEKTTPLSAGDAVPSVTLQDTTGAPVSFSSLYETSPVLVVFYRGGWCPFCTRHLESVAQILDEISEAGVQVVGVSPDRPEALRDTLDSLNLSYDLYSDSGMEAGRAFGLAFRVDEATRTKYQEYGIDLEKASGESHYQLPVPAVYLIDQEGMILYAYTNPDYKTRASGEEILTALEEAGFSSP